MISSPMELDEKAIFLLAYLTQPSVDVYPAEEALLTRSETIDVNSPVLLKRKLVLFPVQQDAILRHEATTNPAYMRLLLDTLSTRAALGGNLWSTLPTLLETCTYEGLLTAVLKLWENGEVPTPESIENAARYNHSYCPFSSLLL